MLENDNLRSIFKKKINVNLSFTNIVFFSKKTDVDVNITSLTSIFEKTNVGK